MPNFTKGDITLAVLVDGVKQEEFPDKNGYKYVDYECNNDAIVDVTYDNEKSKWKVNLSTTDPTICTLKFETKNEYEEEILAGSYPVVKEGLIPVTIANDGTVTKANLKDKWYSYKESNWANAVILNGIDNYSVGQVIPEDAIESYFVWIPKYRYKLFNVEGNSIPAQEIEIEIGDYNTIDSETECIATNKSGDNGTCTNGKWMTHPAFTSLGVNGLWIGKFEATGSTSALTVKPNVTSLRGIDGSTMYNTSFNYKRSLDSHMMKNTEWGAMAYLTNSKYGKGNNEVWINNSSTYITGCTGETVSASPVNNCTYPYPNTNNDNRTVFQGSTTNNISGIYDIAGGAYEYVMGNYNNTAGSSGLTPTSIDNRYKDIYTGDNASNKILGDATGEAQGWNSDYAGFVDFSSPYFIRGSRCSDTISAGVFSSNSSVGSGYAHVSFRMVLSPIK